VPTKIPFTSVAHAVTRRAQENPEDPKVWSELATLLYQRREYEAATRAYRKVQVLYQGRTVRTDAPTTTLTPTPPVRATPEVRPTAEELLARVRANPPQVPVPTVTPPPPPSPPTESGAEVSRKPTADELMRHLLQQDLQRMLALLDERVAKTKAAPKPDPYSVG
jgi:hypothetical protein